MTLNFDVSFLCATDETRHASGNESVYGFLIGLRVSDDIESDKSRWTGFYATLRTFLFTRRLQTQKLKNMIIYSAKKPAKHTCRR